MKVPNKVLHAVRKLAVSEPVSEEERSLVLMWALEGITKRAAAVVAPEATAASKE